MERIAELLWLAPALPLVASGVIALLPRARRQLASMLAIGSVAGALVVSLLVFAASLDGITAVHKLGWFQVGTAWVEIGWILNPLTAVMVVTVSFISLLIFIYSLGYMHEDPNITRFFCFLSLFCAAMLGLVISNSLLLLFICWELVGLCSYLLIGFWYHKPSAAAAAKKAFIVTRIGDLVFLLGIVWLYSKTGTLLLYDSDSGCMEGKALALLAMQTAGPVALTTAIGLLIFAGAIGKSGQVPLHVWLPDAMEGPTPVSALIHAATMVAAGVFLIARVYPLLSVEPIAQPQSMLPQIQVLAPVVEQQPEPLKVLLSNTTTALKVVTWIGVLTALFAAGVAVAQTDIKRILAYSTVSQLGFMMAGLGTGGAAAGIFHLVTHAFFKALLFLGAGSVIHSLAGEHDIQRMGGLRKCMPLTFAAYAAGMLALSGFPLLFSGFWSKDTILHSARHWPGSALPFYLLALAAFLTAFYMTRQVIYIFFGKARNPSASVHESPLSMTLPLLVLAGMALLLSLIGTPAWPWFQGFLSGKQPHLAFGNLTDPATFRILLLSSTIALAGIATGLWMYRGAPEVTDQSLAQNWPDTHRFLANGGFLDLLYDRSLVRSVRFFSRATDWLDRTILAGAVELIAALSTGLAWLSRLSDEFLVNKGFDEGCSGLSRGGRTFDGWQKAKAQGYLAIMAAGVIAIGVLVLWSRL